MCTVRSNRSRPRPPRPPVSTDLAQLCPDRRGESIIVIMMIKQVMLISYTNLHLNVWRIKQNKMFYSEMEFFEEVDMYLSCSDSKQMDAN